MKLVVISNRVPAPTARTGAGGLAVALRDALSESGGAWLGWNGQQAAERATAPSIVEKDDISFATVPLTEDDFERYYVGYANRVLWPLFHEQLHAMEYRESFRVSYHDVNEYFAAIAAPMIDPGDTTWVHDYHLIPLGAALRRRHAGGVIGFFLHTPFPPFDVFRALPEHPDLLKAFLAYDMVGFQTSTDARHFADAMARGIGAAVDATAGLVRAEQREVRFGAFPIGIDAEATNLKALTNRGTRAGQSLTRALRGRKLVIGADRLDYTKGLPERFQAFELLLERHREELDDEMIYVQIAAPSREYVQEYQEICHELEGEVGRINGRHSSIYWTPLRFIEQQVPRDTLLGYFSLSDVGLVTPLRDGMNLVAKEYLASQTAEDPGVLVLSSMAGAAEELASSAIVVNPYSRHDVADGMYRALHMPLEERRRLWERGMATLELNTAAIWRERFLDELLVRSGPSAGPKKAGRTPERQRRPH